MELTNFEKRQQYEQRLDELIRSHRMTQAYANNSAVYRIAQMYLAGDIITKEEAWCQMIVALCENWEEVQKRNHDALFAMQGLNFSMKPKE